MNSKRRLKFMIFLGGVVAAIPLIAIGLSLISEFVVYFQQGADPASIFRGHTLVIPAEEDATWASFDDIPGDTPTRAEREEVIAAYWLAWGAIDNAHRTGDTSDLATYWAGAAYEQVLAGLDDGQIRSQTHTAHTLYLSYFSDDGSVIAFEDRDLSLRKLINGSSIALQANASVVMTLDQGFWRVRVITIDYQ